MVIVANGFNGIRIEAANSLIGGTTTGAGNLISGNDRRGILITGGAASNTIIQGNLIGANAINTDTIGNQQEGIEVRAGANNNLIGGIVPGAGNIITGNHASGISMLAQGDLTNGNRVLGNAIYGNQDLSHPGIDLDGDGVTSNDGQFDPQLANNGIDHPVYTSVSLNNSILTITGYVGSAPNQAIFANARVEIFKSNGASNGYGGGQTYLGFLTTDANGNFSGTLTTPQITVGDTITSTATDTNGNTSEFGPNSTL
jgi:hypothetical protein